jgi:hypothetical protein
MKAADMTAEQIAAWRVTNDQPGIEAVCSRVRSEVAGCQLAASTGTVSLLDGPRPAGRGSLRWQIVPRRRLRIVSCLAVGAASLLMLGRCSGGSDSGGVLDSAASPTTAPAMEPEQNATSSTVVPTTAVPTTDAPKRPSTKWGKAENDPIYRPIDYLEKEMFERNKDCEQALFNARYREEKDEIAYREVETQPEVLQWCSPEYLDYLHSSSLEQTKHPAAAEARKAVARRAAEGFVDGNEVQRREGCRLWAQFPESDFEWLEPPNPTGGFFLNDEERSVMWDMFQQACGRGELLTPTPGETLDAFIGRHLDTRFATPRCTSAVLGEEPGWRNLDHHVFVVGRSWGVPLDEAQRGMVAAAFQARCGA